MPNHCDNTLTIFGTPEELAQVIQAIKGDNGPLDFDKIVPYPEKFKTLDKAAEEYLKANPNDWKNMPKDGFNAGGYEWCVTNWSTKWNAYSFDSDEFIVHDRQAVLKFQTAWSPPVNVIESLGQLFPNVRFHLFYSEPGMMFKGDLTVHGDEIEDIQENMTDEDLVELGYMSQEELDEFESEEA